MIIAAAMVAVLATMLMAMARAFMGPSIYDRVLAINSGGTATVLFIAVLGFLSGRPDFLDIALAYALINFIGTLAVLKFYKYGNLGESVTGDTVVASLSDQEGNGHAIDH